MIDLEAHNLKDEMIRLRRDFHKHPELAFKEKWTANTIANYLFDLGLKVQTGVAKTGVVGLLEGRNPGKTVLLRADMDALPLQEDNDVPYRSQNDKVMHACGHDGHMAILLIVAKILAYRRGELTGQIKFVFQPGEEGFAGARLMIEQGVLQNPTVDTAFGLHLNTGIPVGSLALRACNMMACMDSFTITIRGKGGHAASPEGGVDAILMSAQLISVLQSLISKEVSPVTPLVLHVGTIQGGSAFNIIAEQVELKGTVRIHDNELRNSIPERINRVAKGVTEALRGSHELDYQFGYPPVVNDSAMVDLVKDVGVQVVGAEQVIEISPVMMSDDMGFFLEEVPGCYFFVGAGNAEKGFNQPHHNPRFDFDEEALVVGARVMSRIALACLGCNL